MIKPATSDPTMKFSDLTTELWREYHFPNGGVVRIDLPTGLHVSKSGGHRVATTSGIAEYIPSGWIRLRWETKDGFAQFQF